MNPIYGKRLSLKPHTAILIFFRCPLFLFFLLTFCNEFFDLPHYLFGDEKTSMNQRKGEIILELGTFIFTLLFLFYTRMKLINKIKILEGILSICTYCKQIKIDGKWFRTEDYISKHSMADFSHGICPECLKKNYPEYADEILTELKNISTPHKDHSSKKTKGIKK